MKTNEQRLGGKNEKKKGGGGGGEKKKKRLLGTRTEWCSTKFRSFHFDLYKRMLYCHFHHHYSCLLCLLTLPLWMDTVLFMCVFVLFCF